MTFTQAQKLAIERRKASGGRGCPVNADRSGDALERSNRLSYKVVHIKSVHASSSNQPQLIVFGQPRM